MAENKSSNFNMDDIAFDTPEEVAEPKKLEKKKVDKKNSISIYLSKTAKKNAKKWAKNYNYRSVSSFINDLLENLDVYLDDKEGK